ncbi:MAG: SLC13 family permease [Nitrospirae bacterium]|nr:SLC13 family permease [Nitrospirota bacterium]MDA1304202.1 SLC13 family permease [Nitrospirota bacterium]
MAILALMVCTLSGLIPAAEAFSGFGHPATITIAAVLIISRALLNSGAVSLVARYVDRAVQRPSTHVALLSTVGASLSSIMNNVGALALLMPVALQSAEKAQRSPAVLLMPLSFATILGGLVTLIGTPANIIVATQRTQTLGSSFGMFDFTPAGLVVAVVGVIFVSVFGWRMIPSASRKRKATQELFNIEDYMTEIKVPDDSSIIGQSLLEIEASTEESDALIVGLIRGARSIFRLTVRERVQAGDILLIEAGSEGINNFVSTLGLQLPGNVKATESTQEENKPLDDAPPEAPNHFGTEDMTLVEVVVPSRRSRLTGNTPRSLDLRSRFGVNLLAVSRQGTPYRGRLKSFKFQSGDVLLLQGDSEQLGETISRLGAFPLAKRDLSVGRPQQVWLTIGIFGLAIGAAILQWCSIPVAFVAAASVLVLLQIVPIREVYEQIDWPVIVLIGAMIPVAGALETNGVTSILASTLISVTQDFPPVLLLTVVLAVTMILSDVMNNAATAVVMTPLGFACAENLHLNPDPFLMAVAIGASCAFLTPIGHQNNLLIMGPGGYKFGDYWRMGLLLEVIIVLVAVPMIMWVWPF